MKNYNSITKQYLSSHNLVRVWVKDVATGQERLRQVSRDEAQRLERTGKVFRKD